MDKKEPFGNIAAQNLKIGDIVEWSKWSHDNATWDMYYGVIMEIKNEVKGNRLVSVSIVMPLSGEGRELEFFTPSLRLVSPGAQIEDIDDFNS
jgi:hypothetical protein